MIWMEWFHTAILISLGLVTLNLGQLPNTTAWWSNTGVTTSVRFKIELINIAFLNSDSWLLNPLCGAYHKNLCPSRVSESQCGNLTFRVVKIGFWDMKMKIRKMEMSEKSVRERERLWRWREGFFFHLDRFEIVDSIVAFVRLRWCETGGCFVGNGFVPSVMDLFRW